MPNWCQNSVVIDFSEADLSHLVKMREFIQNSESKDGLFQLFYPMPSELNIVSGRVGSEDDPKQITLEEQYQSNKEKYGFKDWYDWRNANWGTKWDVGRDDVVVGEFQHGDKVVDLHEATKFNLSFDTAWGPASAFFGWIWDELKIMSENAYLEDGMCFCGTDVCGVSDESYDSIDELRGWKVGELLQPLVDSHFDMADDLSPKEMEDKEIEEETKLSNDNGTEDDQRID